MLGFELITDAAKVNDAPTSPGQETLMMGQGSCESTT
jgi:hypothetical protein